MKISRIYKSIETESRLVGIGLRKGEDGEQLHNVWVQGLLLG